MSLITKDENFKFGVQLFDGRDDRFVKLELINSDTNGVIGTYTLNNTGDGFYSKNDLPANTLGIFFARYTVYRNTELTNRDRRYSILLENIRVESIIEQINENVDLSDGTAV